MHILCTICSDLVNQVVNIIVTKCGHIFHHHCLAQWIERSKTCPQCRNKVTERCMFRLYPTLSNEPTADDAATLQTLCDDAQLKLREYKAQCKEKDNQLNEINKELKKTGDLLKTYEKKLVRYESAISALEEQVNYMKIQSKEMDKFREENHLLKQNVQTLNDLQKVLNATSSDVETMLKGYTDVKTIAIFATALKRALCESESKKNDYRNKLHEANEMLRKKEGADKEMQNTIVQLQDRVNTAERKYEALKNKRKATDMGKTLLEEISVKQKKHSGTLDLNTAILEENNSVSSMVHRIENADSPYFSLKQSSLALSALTVPNNSPENRIKPSEFAIINAARAHDKRSSENVALSIFNMKKPITIDFTTDDNTTNLHTSYDGLGGHSKLDIFPIPKSKPVFKNLPKLSAKHKLKRPTVPSGSQDIGKFIERMNH